MFEKACRALHAMSHPVRLQALLLVSRQEWIVGDLATAIRLSQSALSHHLTRLRAAKLVRTRRENQKIYYRCDDETALGILATLHLR